jgi:1,4-alpha-glucan branching enzyme
MGQMNGNPAYHFEGDEVVFVFDIRDFQHAIEQGTSEYLDFSDLKIYDVAISGNFNDWSERGWRMNKQNDYTFELRKRTADFDDPVNWDFKYIINGKHIIDRALSFKDRLYDKFFLNETFGLDVNQIKINEDGAIRFFLPGHENAEEVYLAGSFNAWDPKELKMQRMEGGWQLKCDLPPARYEYKFVVDDVWMHDPDNPDKKRNEYASFNSVIDVTVPVTFTLKGFEKARTVILAGTFNDWNEKDLKMIHEDDVWEISIPLVGGKHHYKFIVDGQWYVDPSNPIWENDGRGNINSVLFVR